MGCSSAGDATLSSAAAFSCDSSSSSTNSMSSTYRPFALVFTLPLIMHRRPGRFLASMHVPQQSRWNELYHGTRSNVNRHSRACSTRSREPGETGRARGSRWRKLPAELQQRRGRARHGLDPASDRYLVMVESGPEQDYLRAHGGRL